MKTMQEYKGEGTMASAACTTNSSSPPPSASTLPACVSTSNRAMPRLWHAVGLNPFGGFQPFKTLLARADYLKSRGGPSAIVHAAYKRRLAAVEKALPNESAVDDAVALITWLRNRGMRVSALGIDLSRVRAPATSTAATSDDLRSDAHVIAALKLLAFEPPRSGHVDATLLTARFFDMDQPARDLAAASASTTATTVITASSIGRTAHRGQQQHQRRSHGSAATTSFSARRTATTTTLERLTALRTNGYLKVTSWAEHGLDVRAFAAAAASHFEQMATQYHRNGDGNASVLRSASPTLRPSLAPLLNSPSLAAIVRGHLGGPVRYEGHSLLEVRGHATPETYRSAFWHHDRCGRRLKLFIYLGDVGEADGRPTMVAKGTHDILHFSYGWHYSLSRIKESFVTENHEVVPLDAPFGGGFLLDTNALHRAALERGGSTRRAVVLEFHKHGKIQRMGKVDNPCPIDRPYKGKVSQNSNWWRGAAGWPLYPQEQPDTRQVRDQFT